MMLFSAAVLARDGLALRARPEGLPPERTTPARSSPRPRPRRASRSSPWSSTRRRSPRSSRRTRSGRVHVELREPRQRHARRQHGHDVHAPQAAKRTPTGRRQIIQRLRPKLAQIPGIRVYPQVPPPIRLGGNLTRAQYQFTLQASDTKDLYASAPTLEEKLRAIKGLQDVNSDLQLRNPTAYLTIDRDRASALGVTPESIENALYTAYGSRQISTIYSPNNEYQVIMELAPAVPARPVGLPAPLRALEEGRPRAPLGPDAPRPDGRAARRQPRGPAPGGHDLLQPRARRVARRGRRGDQQGRARSRSPRPSRRASRGRRRPSRRRRRGSGSSSSSRSS